MLATIRSRGGNKHGIAISMYNISYLFSWVWNTYLINFDHFVALRVLQKVDELRNFFSKVVDFCQFVEIAICSSES